MKKNNIAIIGFGSIGEKHLKNLIDMKFKNEIYIVSRRKHVSELKNVFFLNNIEKLKLKNIKFIIICSPSSSHLIDLKLCYKFLGNKTLFLIEKPIFNDYHPVKKFFKKFHYLNIFVGYQIRYSLALIQLKKILKKFNKKKILDISVSCESFLPNWRSNRNFKKGVSLNKDNGGVLLELCHEINYLILLFRIPKKVFALSPKSRLFKSQVEENIDAKMMYDKNKTINLKLNFDNRFKNERYLKIRYDNYFIHWNLIKKELIIKTTINTKTYYFNNENLLKQQMTFILDETKNKTVNNSLNDSIETLKIIHYLKKSLKTNKVCSVK